MNQILFSWDQPRIYVKNKVLECCNSLYLEVITYFLNRHTVMNGRENGCRLPEYFEQTEIENLLFLL